MFNTRRSRLPRRWVIGADLKRVDENELDFNYEQGTLWRDVPFTGVGVERLADGSLRAETTYVDGVQDGAMTIWHDNGVVAERSWFWRNCVHGRETGWDRDGKLVYERRYEIGLWVGYAYYRSDGSESERWAIAVDDPGLVAHRKKYPDAPAIPFFDIAAVER